MPADRKASGSRAKSKPSTTTSRSLRARDSNKKVAAPAASAAPPAILPEVIVLSDSEDDSTLLARAQRRRRLTPAVPKTSAESSSTARLRQEIEALKKENATLMKSLASARKPDPPHAAIPDLSELEDRITCQICTLKMWSPYTLSECGHTFCESCLHGWFNTTYTHHIEQHPEYLAGPPVPTPAEVGVHRDDPRYRKIVEHCVRHWERHVPKPVFTCPTCRVHIKTKPVEVFALKDMVRLISRVTSREGSPKAKRSNRAVGSMFDGFFPGKTAVYV